MLLRDLKAQLEALKSGKEEAGKQGKAGTDQRPMYEIYARTEAAKFAHLSKVSKQSLVDPGSDREIYANYNTYTCTCGLKHSLCALIVISNKRCYR